MFLLFFLFSFVSAKFCFADLRCSVMNEYINSPSSMLSVRAGLFVEPRETKERMNQL